jgi:hypothetical protein
MGHMKWRTALKFLLFRLAPSLARRFNLCMDFVELRQISLTSSYLINVNDEILVMIWGKKTKSEHGGIKN